MQDIKPIETVYNGYRFRSRLEARWAVFFDSLGISYEYEPEGLVLSDGSRYLPDFYLPQFFCYLEVKRKGLTDEERMTAGMKISDGERSGTWAGIIVFGDPKDHEAYIFCQEYNNSSGGSYRNKVAFDIDVHTRKPILIAEGDSRDRVFLDSFGNQHQIPMLTGAWRTARTAFALDAETRARQARFEYGATPIRKG